MCFLSLVHGALIKLQTLVFGRAKPKQYGAYHDFFMRISLCNIK